MKFTYFVTLVVAISFLPIFNAEILECKVNSVKGNAFCEDYCKSLNLGNNVTGSCARDEVSCICKMPDGRTIKVRVLQDQAPKPHITVGPAEMPPATAQLPLGMHPMAPQYPIRQTQFPFPPQPHPSKQAQRLICDGSPIAATTCNSFCIDSVGGSGGFCHVQDFTCRCMNVPFIKDEPIEAVYIPPQHHQQFPNVNENLHHNNIRVSPTLGPELGGQQPTAPQNQNQPPVVMPSQLKQQSQFQSPVNAVPPPVQKSTLFQQQFQQLQQPPPFFQGMPHPNHPQHIKHQYVRFPQQQFLDRPFGSPFANSFNQQQHHNPHFIPQVPQQQIIGPIPTSSGPEHFPTPNPTMATKVPEVTGGSPSESHVESQEEIHNEALPSSSLTIESHPGNELSQNEHLSNVTLSATPTTEEKIGLNSKATTEDITDVPETTLSPPQTTSTAEPPQITNSSTTEFAQPPFIYGWQGMPMRKMNPIKRLPREPACTAESCVKKCADRGFAECQSICNPAITNGNACNCLCSFGSSVRSSTIRL